MALPFTTEIPLIFGREVIYIYIWTTKSAWPLETHFDPRSKATRFLPNVEFAASWWCVAPTEELWRNPWKLAPRVMPREVWSRWDGKGVRNGAGSQPFHEKIGGLMI